MSPPKVTGIFDTACTVDLSGDRESPSFASPFYRNHQTCSPNVEVVGEGKEGKARVVVDFSAGENSHYTQSAGLKIGDGIDLVQAFIEYGESFFVGLGKRVTGMGWEVIRADGNDFIFRDPNFGLIPYTETGVWAGYRRGKFELKLGLTPGPDHVIENNGASYGTANVTWGPFFANYQLGPDQDDNTSQWRHTADIGVSLDLSSSLSLKLYGLLGREEFKAGPQSWRGANLSLKISPPDLPMGLVFGAGYTADDGARTGITNLSLLGMTAGLNFYLVKEGKGFLKEVQFRLQADQRGSLNGGNPLNGRSSQTRAAAQVVTVF